MSVLALESLLSGVKSGRFGAGIPESDDQNKRNSLGSLAKEWRGLGSSCPLYPAGRSRKVLPSRKCDNVAH